MNDTRGPRVFVRKLRVRSQGRAKRHRLPSAGKLRKIVLHTLARAAPHITGDVTVVLTTDSAIRALNRRYRNKDIPTDVLAFPIGEGLHGQAALGDVVVSVETARRQAEDYGATLSEELSRLLIHGTLHLCGYDHHERAQAARMQGLTRRLLREVAGFPANGKAAHA